MMIIIINIINIIVINITITLIITILMTTMIFLIIVIYTIIMIKTSADSARADHQFIRPRKMISFKAKVRSPELM